MQIGGYSVSGMTGQRFGRFRFAGAEQRPRFSAASEPLATRRQIKRRWLTIGALVLSAVAGIFGVTGIRQSANKPQDKYEKKRQRLYEEAQVQLPRDHRSLRTKWPKNTVVIASSGQLEPSYYTWPYSDYTARVFLPFLRNRKPDSLFEGVLDIKHGWVERSEAHDEPVVQVPVAPHQLGRSWRVSDNSKIADGSLHRFAILLPGIANPFEGENTFQRKMSAFQNDIGLVKTALKKGFGLDANHMDDLSRLFPAQNLDTLFDKNGRPNDPDRFFQGIPSKRIEESLKQLGERIAKIKQDNPEANIEILFYYTGHGAAMYDGNLSRQGSLTGLVMTHMKEDLEETMLKRWFAKYLHQADEVVLLVDACESGSWIAH